MTDFSALLSKQVDQAERPKPLPAGTYLCTVVKHEFGESKRNKTPYCRFTFQPVEPCEDVDMEQLEEMGGVSVLQKKSLRNDYWLTEQADFRLREFLEDACQIDCTGRSFGETIPETDQAQVKVSVTHQVSDDGQDIFTNVQSVSAA